MTFPVSWVMSLSGTEVRSTPLVPATNHELGDGTGPLPSARFARNCVHTMLSVVTFRFAALLQVQRETSWRITGTIEQYSVYFLPRNSSKCLPRDPSTRPPVCSLNQQMTGLHYTPRTCIDLWNFLFSPGSSWSGKSNTPSAWGSWPYSLEGYTLSETGQIYCRARGRAAFLFVCHPSMRACIEQLSDRLSHWTFDAAYLCHRLLVHSVHARHQLAL